MRPQPLLFVLAAIACGGAERLTEMPEPSGAPPQVVATAPVPKVSLEPEAAAPASERIAVPSEVASFQKDIQTVFGGLPGHRYAIQTDKPLYRPGETIWFRGFDQPLQDTDRAFPVQAELLDPSGAVVAEGLVKTAAGTLVGQFDLPAGINGGRFVLAFTQGEKEIATRPIIVDTFEAPRMQKKVDFVRQAYGAGETVKARVTFKRPTGEPLVGQTLQVLANVDGRTLPAGTAVTDAKGQAVVAVALPATFERGEGLLTVVTTDGGITESISRPMPLVAKRVELAFFPEGGDLVEGLESRVYFRARKLTGKPADISGEIRDDQGETVAVFTSLREGLGRFTFTPKAGRSYHAVVGKPSTIEGTYALPDTAKDGCALRVFDDYSSELASVRAAVHCTSEQVVTVQGYNGERAVDTAAVAVSPGQPGVVYLQDVQRQMGPVRVTALSREGAVLAERLVFRHPDRALSIDVKPQKAGVSPRQDVVLDIETKDADGKPVAASLALAVVDETVLSLADDKEPHLLSAMMLQSVSSEPIFEPNRYFDVETEDRLAALDLVMGTYGWRRYEWVRTPTPEMVAHRQDVQRMGMMGRQFLALGMDEAMDDGAMMEPEMVPMAPMAAPPPGRPAKAKGARKPRQQERKREEEKNNAPMADMQAQAAPPPPPVIEAAEVLEEEADFDKVMEAPPVMVMAKRARRADGLADRGRPRPVNPWMQVRQFPIPTFPANDDGPRRDFRDTIFWNGNVTTDADGKASVTFPASDAITSFRVDTQGTAGGNIGRHETSFNNKLPFSMALKLPRTVTEGDRIDLPLALVNELDRDLALTLSGTFGSGVKTDWSGSAQTMSAGERKAETLTFDVVGRDEPVELSFAAYGSGQNDAFSRTVDIQGKGFPMLFEKAKDLTGRVEYDVDLGKALPGTVKASVTLYPGPAGSLMEGLEGLLREPGGCFEQTSSSNYPNIMVMQYLEENDLVEPELYERASGMLDRGYDRLVGFETSEKGYEWFGGTPAHEALTAYGLVEFIDMAEVHDEVDRSMIARTEAYLLKRRDGKGGYKRSSQALDSFGRAAEVTTNAYITWSLAVAGSGPKIGKELDVARDLAKSSTDAYVLALSADALLQAGDMVAGKAGVARLVSLQGDDGGFTDAAESITRSGGQSLHIETTALAALAMLDAGEKGAPLRKAVEFIHGSRSGHGSFGSTQSTILALKALTRYANATRAPEQSGVLTVEVNGKNAGEFAYEAGHQGAITIDGFGGLLKAGGNKVVVRHDGASLPMTFVVDYRSDQPASAPDTAVVVTTALDADSVPVGQTVRLDATVTNTTDVGQPMTLARVGIPGGLTPQTWQLEDLRKEGKVDFFETTPKEVILYWRDFAPEAVAEIGLDLVAEVPGRYTSGASSSYLYYTPEKKHWVAGETVYVTQ